MNINYSNEPHQVSVQDPVGVQIVDAVQDLVEQRLYHPTGQLERLLIGLGGSVELDDVLQRHIDHQQDKYCI